MGRYNVICVRTGGVVRKNSWFSTREEAQRVADEMKRIYGEPYRVSGQEDGEPGGKPAEASGDDSKNKNKKK